MNNQRKDISVDEVTKPKLVSIDGGRLAPDAPITFENWLLKMEEGTNFLCKKKKTAPITNPVDLFAVHEFMLVVKRHFEETKEWGVLLNTGFGEKTEELWVDPFRFTSQYDLVGVLS